MRKEIKDFVARCLVCQQTKYSTCKPSGLLQPLPIPSNVWEDISLDFITGLPLSGGYSVLLVVVDRFSKYTHLGALPSHFTAYKVAELFVNMVVYGKEPPTIATYVLGASKIAATDDLLNEREEVLSMLRKNLTKAQERMKTLADNHRRDVSFEVNSYVHVKLQPYRQSSVSGVKYNKLQKRYYGLFRVCERIGQVAYKLELPSHSKIHNVFHCSLLKPYLGPIPPDAPILPHDSVDNHPIVTPLAILNSRIISVNGQQIQQVLVQWNGLPPEDTTWENWQDLQISYNLEDKVEFDGIGNDTDSAAAVNNGSEAKINTTSTRPVRNKRLPAKFNDHLIYK
ncbi:uncharacterized protein LOC131659663 [Vicia villosa]|uniref:uncharacterized protein LOC131659663 n=1 Tax=Vicia villosa TaxID=3911 RepID=UPI00273B3CF7|nr:uncharacterized protein LOC131659663 [Vicia villosa]